MERNEAPLPGMEPFVAESTNGRVVNPGSFRDFMDLIGAEVELLGTIETEEAVKMYSSALMKYRHALFQESRGIHVHIIEPAGPLSASENTDEVVYADGSEQLPIDNFPEELLDQSAA